MSRLSRARVRLRAVMEGHEPAGDPAEAILPLTVRCRWEQQLLTNATSRYINAIR
jgi:hypothetical protein